MQITRFLFSLRRGRSVFPGLSVRAQSLGTQRLRVQSLRALGLGALALVLVACQSGSGEGDPSVGYPEKTAGGGYDPSGSNKTREGIMGSGGFFGGGKKKEDGEGGAGIGVNSFLWRATLDTISFMPLVSADPFGGVIITDWYNPAQTPNERFKMTVYILDRALRADGLRVSVFKQVRQGPGWVDQPSSPDTAIAMENSILQRARELRVEAEARR